MSEVASVVEQEQQQQQQHSQQQQPLPPQQQYVGGSSNTEPYCEECNISFNSDKSLQVHLQYHNHNLIKRWTNSGQQESNNNNSKAGNHNKHVSAKQDTVAVPTDSREPSSSQDHSQQPPSIQAYNNYLAPIPYTGVTNLLQNMSHVQNIQIGTCQPFSPSQEDVQNNGGNGNVGGGYARYHPYPQHFSTEHASTNSTSPHSPPFHCENCGAVYEDASQLGEHVKTHHSDSPSGYAAAPQYQQLGGSPPQPDQQQQAQLHASPTHSSQPQQQPSYDFNGGQPVKLEMKQEPEEQAEILDLDSHKVQQTHRYQEELMRYQQQHRQQEMQMHIHHQQQVMQQRIGPPHSMLGWTSVAQAHDYHTGLPAMAPMDGMQPIADQSQFMRSQHMPVVEAPVHQAASIITNAQPMPSHQVMSPGLPLQQQLKPPSNQTWKSNEPRRPKTYNCTACNKWFTSSGHLKRHYNTTLHKNAVKQSNQPDPANLPISSHHHPSRDNNVTHSTNRGGGGSGGGGAPERSPDFASSGSPPNVMAGPSGEATGGLHHTPIPHYNSSSSSNSNSNDSLAAAAALAQQQGPSAVHLASGMVPHSSPQSSMAGHHQQPMGSPSHQMGLQQQQQPLHHLPMTSPGQHQVHHTMTSSISPMHPPLASHMSSPSPMDSSTHPHHMNSSSTIAPGTVHPAMVSPTAMGGTSMPHQPYPNALPPHVTNTSSIPGLLKPTIQTSIGRNDQNQNEQHQKQQQAQDNMLPGFGTLNQHQTLPSFTQLVPGFGGDQTQPQAVNVGGLSSEEATEEKSYSSSVPSYDLYTNSQSRYGLIGMDPAMGTVQTDPDDMIIRTPFDMSDEQSYRNHFEQMDRYTEKNNNELPHMMQIKQESADSSIGPPIIVRPARGRKPKSGSTVLKEQQLVSSTTVKVEIDETDNRTVQCDECTKRFNKACYLTQHKKSFHMGEKPFKCPQCGKRFTSDDSFQQHLQKHDGEKPHKCDSCPKQFNHKTDLRRHRCLHTGDKPYSCTNCGKKFIRKDHMVKHVQTHSKKTQRRGNTEHKKENVRRRVTQCP
ncbi:PREDICTED: alpha-protein kinase 1 [Dinoponera quadriceps]|uniref:Alpha-protein kinase 1 n=1 Tax=Dinoponera quadriceps TaxID=609295 RepID=A0A6P3XSY8_DINQU|nr:PREDICTED: alpha-protein kinase 1 [Dinoponera quadriceps]